MDQLMMIEKLLKLGPVKAIVWDSVEATPRLAQVEFYPADMMQEMLKKAAASGDSTLVDVIKDLIEAE